MNCLNIVRVVVPPCSAHAFGMDVIGHHVAVVSEPPLAESANALLGDNFPVKELPHFAIGAEFPVSPGMLRILDTPNSHLALAPFSWDCLSSTAEEGAVDRTGLIPAESHGGLLVGRETLLHS
jgi:hypothetical protein